VKLYHGIVRKSLLDELKEKTGKYFDGLSPDIYIGTALSLLKPKMVSIDFSLVITGSNCNSASAKSTIGQHTGLLKDDAIHFTGHKDYHWNKAVPEFYSVETIWAETSLHAFANLGMSEYIAKFDVAALDSMLIEKYGSNSIYKELVNSHFRNWYKEIPGWKQKIMILREYIERRQEKYKFLFTAVLRRLSVPSIKYDGVQDISEAEAWVNKELESNIRKFLKNNFRV